MLTIFIHGAGKLKLDGWPTYCGGRILTGLYNTDSRTIPDGKLIHILFDPKVHGYSKPAGVPNDFESFLYVLKLLCSTDHSGRSPSQIGTLIAVTNKGQTIAASHFEKAGFDMVANTEKVNGYGYCKTWVIDFRKKLWPMIKDLPEPKCLTEYKASLKKTPKGVITDGVITSVDQLYNGLKVYFHKDNRDGVQFGRKGDYGIVRDAQMAYNTGKERIAIPIILHSQVGSTIKDCYTYSTDVTTINPDAIAAEKTTGLSFVRKLSPTLPQVENEAVRISPITGRPVRKYTRKVI